MVINEIFRSIDGEVNSFHQGRMTTFVRMQGCNLHDHPCKWCDTKAALKIDQANPDENNFYAGEYTVNSLFNTIVRFWGKSRNITITGGEPFMPQHVEEVCQLISRLMFHRFDVNVETNGKYKIPEELIPFIESRHLCIVSDFKMPSSGNYNPDDARNFFNCNFVKFVICTLRDLEIAMEQAETVLDLNRHKWVRPKIVFSPVIMNDNVNDSILKSVISRMEDTDYILNIQLHKLLGLK